MPAFPNQGDLARAKCQEANDDWPTCFELVAYWGDREHPRRKSRRIEITADQYFGRNGHGAPMTAEQLFQIIERLRRSK